MTTAPAFARSTAAPADIHFDWADPLWLDEALSQEERMVRDRSDDYCREKPFPPVFAAASAFRSRDHEQRWGRSAFLARRLRAMWVATLSITSLCKLIAREVERVDRGYRSAMSVQSSLTTERQTGAAAKPEAGSEQDRVLQGPIFSFPVNPSGHLEVRDASLGISRLFSSLRPQQQNRSPSGKPLRTASRRAAPACQPCENSWWPTGNGSSRHRPLAGNGEQGSS